MFDIANINKFCDVMANDGITTDEALIADKELHRFHVIGDSPGTLNGWYVLFPEPFLHAAYGSWKLYPYETKKWSAKAENEMTIEEKNNFRSMASAVKEKQEQIKIEAHAKAKELAYQIWAEAKPTLSNHPYLVKKNVKAQGIKISNIGELIIPIRDSQKVIHSLQFIDSEGRKKFLKDGAIKGHYFSIGKLTETLIIVEGLATGLTAHQATGYGVVVAFNCGNLLEVAQTIRKKFPTTKLIIAADDDSSKPRNPGLTHARQAAESIGATIAIPCFDGLDITSNPSDFNDLARLTGIDEVKRQLDSAVTCKDLKLTNFKECTEETNKQPNAEINNNISTAINLGKINLLDESNERPKQKSQVTLLIEIARQIEVFHDDKKVPYVIVPNKNLSKGCYPVHSNNFKSWLSQCFYILTGKGCRLTNLNDALATIEARAKFESPTHSVYLRFAREQNRIFIDIGDDSWKVIEITQDGWKVLEKSPVMFVRSDAMKPLPLPITGGNLDDLWQCLNITKEQRILVLGWVLCCLRGKEPFPILNVQGEEGSGKTFLCNIVRDLVDPSIGENRNIPTDDKELLAAIVNSAVLSLDNISKIDDRLSDTLCRVSTGGAISFRALFTNTDEVIYKIARAIILNGITDIVTRPDLLSRCISIYLEPIDDNHTKSEEEILAYYNSKKASILGVIYDLVAGGLKYLSEVQKPKKLPRLADCVIWVTAIEKGTCNIPEGTFASTYSKSIKTAIEEGIDSSPAMRTLLSFMQYKSEWSGTTSLLLDELTRMTNESLTKASIWPHTPKGLSNIIKRYTPQLRKLGIEITKNRIHGSNITTLSKIQDLDTPRTPDTIETNHSGKLEGANSDNSYTPLHTPFGNALGVSSSLEGAHQVHKENTAHTPEKPSSNAACDDMGVRSVCNNPNIQNKNQIKEVFTL